VVFFLVFTCLHLAFCRMFRPLILAFIIWKGGPTPNKSGTPPFLCPGDILFFSFPECPFPGIRCAVFTSSKHRSPFPFCCWSCSFFLSGTSTFRPLFFFLCLPHCIGQAFLPPSSHFFLVPVLAHIGLVSGGARHFSYEPFGLYR